MPVRMNTRTDRPMNDESRQEYEDDSVYDDDEDYRPSGGRLSEWAKRTGTSMMRKKMRL